VSRSDEVAIIADDGVEFCLSISEKFSEGEKLTAY